MILPARAKAAALGIAWKVLDNAATDVDSWGYAYAEVSDEDAAKIAKELEKLTQAMYNRYKMAQDAANRRL